VEQLNKLPLVKRIPTAQLQVILSVLVLVPGYIRPAGANRRRSQNRQQFHAALSRNGPDPKSKRKCKSRGRGAAQRLGQVRQCNGRTSGTGAGGAGSDLQVEVGAFASRDPGTNRNQVQSSVTQRRDLPFHHPLATICRLKIGSGSVASSMGREAPGSRPTTGFEGQASKDLGCFKILRGARHASDCVHAAGDGPLRCSRNACFWYTAVASARSNYDRIAES
jgi:hypothetical protein